MQFVVLVVHVIFFFIVYLHMFASILAVKLVWIPRHRIIGEHRKGSHFRARKAFQQRNLLKESKRYKD